MQCSECNSEQIQKLSFVHESGVTHVASKTGFAAVGAVGRSFGGGLGSGVTQGTQITAMSARAAPPKPLNTGMPAFAFIAFAIFGAGFHGLWIIAVLALLGFIGGTMWNRNVWRPQYQRWNELYLCNRCGSIMKPVMQSNQAGQPRDLSGKLDQSTLPPPSGF